MIAGFDIRAAALGVFFCAAPAGLAPPAAAQPPETIDLSGKWRIEMIEGPSKGDHAVMTVRPAAPGEEADGARFYDAEMRFTDSRTGRTAAETCVLKAIQRAVTVRCATNEPNWAPDDFDLTIVAPDRMRGPHTSAVSGEALFFRQGLEDLTS